MPAGPASRVVVDMGNTLMKWGLLDESGMVVRRTSLRYEDRSAWDVQADQWALGGLTRWAVCSVNPPLESSLADWITHRGGPEPRWFRSAREVFPDVRSSIPETAGVDRAMMVLASRGFQETGRPTLIVSCGTAITVDRINSRHAWEGGVIAAGMGLCARGMREQTALLPLIMPVDERPDVWGNRTETAMKAGIFWGAVGAVREIVSRQRFEAGAPFPLRIWTGGDASLIAKEVDGPDARIVPDLVLRGVAMAASSPLAETDFS